MSEKHQMWADKYRPDSFSSLQGNNSAIKRLKSWVEDFPADREPQMLVGDRGTGKTSTVEVIAASLDMELVELNASNLRSSDDIEDMAGVIRGRSADGERRIVMLDEADNWHHAANKKPLYDALDDPANPVVVIVNDKWDTPSALVSRCNEEEFSLSKRSIKSRLKDVVEAEDLSATDQMLTELAKRGDLRSAINDLQVWADADRIPEDYRQMDVDEMDMIDAMLTGTELVGDLSPSDLILWLDENASASLRGLELAWVYETLSRADVTMMQNSDVAEQIIRQVPYLRITEPYYGDEVGWDDKSFPEWFRHKKPKAHGGASEAKLYRALSNYESGEFGLDASYNEFRRHVLPILKDMDREEKCQLILKERLEPEEFEALDVTEAQYEDWIEDEEVTEGDGLQRTEQAGAW